MKYNGKDNLEVLELAKNYNQFLVSLVSKEWRENQNNIVDFGAGTGFLSEKIAQVLDCKVHCVECADNLEKCYNKKESLVLHKNLNEIKNGTVDLLYSFNVLEHIEDDKKIVCDLVAKVKKGGCLIFYLPAFSCLFSSMDEKVGHYRRYNKKMLRELLNNVGVEIVNCQYCDFAGFFITVLYKILGNKQGDINIKALKFFDKVIFPCSRFMDRITRGKFLGKNVLVIAKKS